MPAVNPTRLSFQIADLLQSFTSPEEFHNKIRDLFSLYANRTLRTGDQTRLAPMIPMFHLPNPVMQQLKTELQPLIAESPQEALALADALWRDEAFEIRQAAAFLLGRAVVADPTAILLRLDKWLTPNLDPALKEVLLNSGTQGLQSRFPDRWEAWVESMLTRKDPKWESIGLIGLRVGLQESPSQKLPVVFRLISLIIRDPQPEILNELKRLINALAQQSPTETAYFLRQALSLSESPETARLIRGCLTMFPDNYQKELQVALKQNRP
jgi:hypothetical protein